MNNLNIIKYSDKSFVLYGPGTKEHKDTIKELGGSFRKTVGPNSSAGWLFPQSKYPAIKEKYGFEEDLFDNTNKSPTKSSTKQSSPKKPYIPKSVNSNDINYVKINDNKEILVYGAGSIKIKDLLKSWNGTFRSNLKQVGCFVGGPAWRLSSKYIDHIEKIKNGKIDELKEEVESIEPIDFKIVEYDKDRSLIFGTRTKELSEDLKSIGCVFKTRLTPKENYDGQSTWIFNNNIMDKVKELIDDIDNKIVINWKLYVPKVGMVATVKIEDQDQESYYIVDKVEEYTIYIKPSNDDDDTDELEESTKKLVICNGSWQVRGLFEDHTITFSKD